MGQTVFSATLTDLTPYSGEWTAAQVTHLLRRTGYGILKSEVDQILGLGMEAAVDMLLADQPLPSPPINYEFENDPNVPIGETWVNQPLVDGVNVNNYRRASLRSWMIEIIRKERLSVRETMVLFWTNHFGIATVNQPQVRYDYHRLLQTYALGNFRDLIKEITINPAMLVFLNGNQNNVNSPNENYSRELLELFSIGKGPQIGEGDYTNYTEDDVRALARALTGWRTRYFGSTDPNNLPESYFQANRHDTTDKQLSYHFNNDIISDGGALEYQMVVDRIFQEDEVARFICRKLYRHFVYYKISDAEETEVIEAMAQLLIANDYEIRPVLAALLKSEHFYDFDNRGPMIKNPMQFTMGLLRSFGYDHLDTSLSQDRRILQFFFSRAALMDMDYFNPPSVAGWEAYYQAPGFYRIWINSSTLQERSRLTNQLLAGFNQGGMRFDFDWLGWIEQIPNATDPNDLIQGITELLLPRDLTEGQLANLKEALIPGLPDFEWTVEYGIYLESPDDEDLRNSVLAKLRDLFRAVFNLAEFQLV